MCNPGATPSPPLRVSRCVTVLHVARRLLWSLAHLTMVVSCHGALAWAQLVDTVLVFCVLWGVALLSLFMFFKGVYARLAAVFMLSTNIMALILSYAVVGQRDSAWDSSLYFLFSSFLLMGGIAVL